MRFPRDYCGNGRQMASGEKFQEFGGWGGVEFVFLPHLHISMVKMCFPSLVSLLFFSFIIFHISYFPGALYNALPVNLGFV